MSITEIAAQCVSWMERWDSYEPLIGDEFPLFDKGDLPRPLEWECWTGKLKADYGFAFLTMRRIQKVFTVDWDNESNKMDFDPYTIGGWVSVIGKLNELQHKELA